ncbi:MAG: hypothetical protein V2A34_11200, partial [Lentisphaerota bacterium]
LESSSQPIKYLAWFGQGDKYSLWMDLSFRDESCYLDQADWDNLPLDKKDAIRHKFLPGAQGKLYTCHAAVDTLQGIVKVMADELGIEMTGANSWVFGIGHIEKGKIRTYFYPATRRDYARRFPDHPWDNAYEGPSRWITILPQANAGMDK